MNSASPVIEFQSVEKRFASTVALREATFAVAPGERVAIVGPNGSGKTTLLKLCAGLLRPTRGRIHIYGTTPRRSRRRIGFLGHESYLYPHLTLYENLLFFARLYAVAPGEISLRLRDAGLEHRAQFPAAALSRGEVQRAQIARALLHSPDLLLLDEPLSSVDEDSRDALTQLLTRVPTSLIATHDARWSAANTTRTLAVHDGRLFAATRG